MRESYTKHFDSRSNRAMRTLNDLTRGTITKKGTYYTRGGGKGRHPQPRLVQKIAECKTSYSDFSYPGMYTISTT